MSEVCIVNNSAITKGALTDEEAAKALGLSPNGVSTLVVAAEANFVLWYNGGAPHINNDNCFEVNRYTGPDGKPFIEVEQPNGSAGGDTETVKAPLQKKKKTRLRTQGNAAKVQRLSSASESSQQRSSSEAASFNYDEDFPATSESYFPGSSLKSSSYSSGFSCSSQEHAQLFSGRNSPPNPSLLSSHSIVGVSPNTMKMREELAAFKAQVGMHERMLAQREELEARSTEMQESFRTQLQNSYQQHTSALSNAHHQQCESQRTQALANSFGRFENATPAHAAMFSVLAANQPSFHQHSDFSSSSSSSSSTHEVATGSLDLIENGESVIHSYFFSVNK